MSRLSSPTCSARLSDHDTTTRFPVRPPVTGGRSFSFRGPGRMSPRPPHARTALTSRNTLAGQGRRLARRSRRPDAPGARPGRAGAEDQAGHRRSKVQRYLFCCGSGPCDDSGKIIRCRRAGCCPRRGGGTEPGRVTNDSKRRYKTRISLLAARTRAWHTGGDRHAEL